VDDKLGRDVVAQLRRIAKAQERTADALEATVAADPLAMIQEALEAEERATGAQDEPDGQGAAIAAYVASLR